MRYIGAVAVNPIDPNYLYIANYNKQQIHDDKMIMARSKDGGVTWEQLGEDFAFAMGKDIYINPKDYKNIFFVTSFSLIEAYDNGAPIATDITQKPTAPSNLAVTNVTKTEATITWQDNSSNESGFKLYEVSGDTPEFVTTFNANSTSFHATGLDCGAHYKIALTAYNDNGESNATNVVDVQMQPCSQSTTTTVYEDAEDGLTTGWVISGDTAGATVENIADTTRGSRVIKLTGNATNTTYHIGGNGRAGSWNNTIGKTIEWSMNFNENFSILVSIKTQDGNRFLIYNNEDTDQKGIVRGGNVRYGLGSDIKDGAWHTVTKNLESDWNAFNPNNPIVAVNGFYVKGSGMVDDILLK